MINVKVVGSNCKNGNQLYKNIQRVINNIRNKDIKILKEDAHSSLQKYNIKDKPGLIIDDKVICQGKVLNERELYRLLSVFSPI